MAFPALDFEYQLRFRPIKPEPPPPATTQREEVTRLRAELAQSVAAKVSNGAELIRALAKQRRDEVVPTTLTPFDELLGGGLARGKMTELAGRGARFSVVLAAIASATSMGEAAALIDAGDHFDPQLAEMNGVDLQRLLWVRPRTMQEAVAAAEMIGTSGFQLIVVDAGVPPLRGRRLPDAAWVRLARTAEAHGNALLISTPYPVTGTASEAVVRTRALRPRWLANELLAGMDAEMTLEKHRHRKPGTTATLHFAMTESIAATAPHRNVLTFTRPADTRALSAKKE
jgi:hypothetical protein